MAKQNPSPPVWNDSMSDGCTWVLDWLPFVGNMTWCCTRHDEEFHFGGNVTDWKRANKNFYNCIRRKKKCWFCYQVSKVVAYWRRGGVRRFGRSSFNWLGPGMRKARIEELARLYGG